MVQSSNNEKIAKNTIYLYIRTVVVMLVSLYTSRLVLELLGETDLGIYNLVGGIVTLLSFLQVGQNKATSRFFTYELGLGNNTTILNRIFSLCMTIHIIIAIVVFLLGETVGLWIVNTLTDIPQNRILAANIVYQLSLLTFVFQFARVPYDSLIVAYEEMSIYAYMSIIEVIFQIVSVVVLLQSKGDALILYASCVALIYLVLLLLFRCYVVKKWKFYKFVFLWDRVESCRILSFSGWTLLGGASNTVSQQGVCLLLNNFVGLVANTALGFANQVNTAVSKFIASFMTAFTPQIIKYYAQSDLDSMHSLMNRASKFSFILCYVMALPLIFNMEYILNIWLHEVPQYTVPFCQLILTCTLFDSLSGVFNTAITATDNVRQYQFFIAVSFCIDFFCAFVLLLIKVPPALVFGSRIITRGLINMGIGMYYCRKQIRFDVIRYVTSVIIPVSLTIIISIPILWFCKNSFSGLVCLLISAFVSSIIIISCLYLIVMDKHEKTFVKNKIIKIVQNDR